MSSFSEILVDVLSSRLFWQFALPLVISYLGWIASRLALKCRLSDIGELLLWSMVTLILTVLGHYWDDPTDRRDLDGIMMCMMSIAVLGLIVVSQHSLRNRPAATQAHVEITREAH